MDALDGHDFVIGFQDESSPQTTANTVRLWSCAQHGLNLGGESPLQALQWELLAETKGVHREVESERRSRQNLGPTNRKRI